MATHEVTNQPPPLFDYDALEADPVLSAGLEREGAGWAVDGIRALARTVTSEEAAQWARLANEQPPVLRTHDRYGRRVDELEFHPAWHALMRLSVEAGTAGGPWRDPRPGAHVARAAKMMLVSENEAGHGCPVSMTYSAVPALQREPALGGEWTPRIAACAYDPRDLPAARKTGALIGMAMTEKQGGSDVRANTTRAEPDGGAFALTGHKWFCSAPMSDAFLVLAQEPAGLSCFLVPRFLQGGARNAGFLLQRLKHKLGNRSNASAELELDRAFGQRVGEAGRGVATILEMVNHTRLDCVIGSSAMMRAAVVQCVHHARHRKAFGKALRDQPLMRAVLADLALESEAATTLMLRLARAYDEGDRPFRRIATAIAKYWVCKRAPQLAAEAVECLGGNGYTEDFPLARLYREAPVNSIWEGSGNVQCLDVLRALQKEPEARDALAAELQGARGADRRLDAAVDDVLARLVRTDEVQARRLVESLALALQGALLVQHAPEAVADAFCASRLAGDWGRAFGTLPPGLDTAAIVDRAFADS